MRYCELAMMSVLNEMSICKISLPILGFQCDVLIT
jgi:hypothetical protein